MGAVFSTRVAAADEPQPWQTGFQEAASPVMERIADLNLLLTVIIVGITTLVLGLILFSVWRFRARRNPVPSRGTHNTPLEVLWTVTPVAILGVIAGPSFQLLYYMDRPPAVDMTLKVTSHQWYWSYEYPDQGGLAFDSFIVPDEKLKPGEPRLLTVDNPAVLPVGTTIRVLVTSTDVLHGFAVPALGVKIDTVPGRLNATWFRIERPGTYYGQCSELCGVGHAFMPIAIKAVSRDEFAAWVKREHDKTAMRATPRRFADAAGAADAR
jgi:cytochrome c oxidase subunit 2